MPEEVRDETASARVTRTGPDTLELAVTISDPTTWTKSWTVKEEFTKQDDTFNRIYKDPVVMRGISA